jgi:hypothetical protein
MKKFIVLFAALALVVAFTVPASADVSLWGSARFMTYSKTIDSEQLATAGYTDDDTDTQWSLGTLSRFGAKFTGGDVGGMWEMDARQNVSGIRGNSGYVGGASDATTLGDVRMRHLFGTWNFGSGELLIGQTWPLANFFVSHLNYYTNGEQFWGGVGYLNARVSQIRLTFGDFKVAFLSPNVDQGTGPASVGLFGSTEVDTTLPKIELLYTLKLEPVKLDFVGGYQTYEVATVGAGAKSYDITSWVVGAAAYMNFGAAYVNVALHYAQNPGNYNLGDVVGLTYDAAYAGTSDIEDMTGYGGVIAVGFKVSDMVTLEAGYSKLDYSGDFPGGGGDIEDAAQSYYLQAKFTMAPGVYIVPEIAVFDKEDRNPGGGAADVEEGQSTVFGVWWCINFK